MESDLAVEVGEVGGDGTLLRNSTEKEGEKCRYEHSIRGSS